MPFNNILHSILGGLEQGGKSPYKTEPIPGHSATSNPGWFPNILGGIFGGHFPYDVPVHGQGQPAPDTGPVQPDIGGGIGESGGQSQSLFDILTQLAMGGNQGDPAAMSKQAMDMAAMQFDPQIAELQREMGITEHHANDSKQQIGQMYSALQGADKADIPVIDKMFGGQRNTINNDYKQLQGQVSGAYSDAQKQQMDLMKQLNIQAAAPDALKQQKTDQAFFTGQQGQSKQDTLDAMQLLQTGADNFSTQGAEIAGLEGNNRQADVMSKLQDYMTMAQGKVGDLQGQKQNAYQTALGQLGSQQQQGSQQQFSNLLQLARMQMEMQQQQGQDKNYKSGPLAASQYLGENDPSQATNLNSFLLQVLQGQPFTTGQVPNPGDPSKSSALTPEAAAQLAVQQAAAAGMSPQSQQELYMAMLAYYGRMSG